MGWARRPKQGEMLGRDTVYLFLHDIDKRFNLGNNSKGKKMSGAQMKSALELEYPERHDLPTEQKVTKTINALTIGNRTKKDCHVPRLYYQQSRTVRIRKIVLLFVELKTAKGWNDVEKAFVLEES